MKMENTTDRGNVAYAMNLQNLDVQGASFFITVAGAIKWKIGANIKLSARIYSIS